MQRSEAGGLRRGRAGRGKGGGLIKPDTQCVEGGEVCGASGVGLPVRCRWRRPAAEGPQGAEIWWEGGVRTYLARGLGDDAPRNFFFFFLGDMLEGKREST